LFSWDFFGWQLIRAFLKNLCRLNRQSHVDDWLAQPNVKLVLETDEHWRQLREMLHEIGAAANLTNDAHLASLAVASGATLVSCDADFRRFRRLRWENPLDE
jgi:uncharacterized protein